MKEKDYPERVEIPEELLSEAQKIVISGFMREGEVTYKEELVSILENEVSSYLAEVDNEPNIEWVDGVRYAIHLIKEMGTVNE